MAKPPEKPAKPIRLSTGSIIDGKFYRAGEPVPYTSESDLPESLRPLVTTGEEAPFFSPAERDIYSPHLRREARRIQGDVQWQSWCEEHAGPEPLPPGVEEVLQAEHDLRIGKALAQAKVNQDAVDAAYEGAAQRAEEAQTQFFVKRGGEWARAERAKLKPAETV